MPWHPDRRLCGRNISSYYVDVKTSTPILNFFMGVFGSFPQDLCDPAGSKAREAVNVEDSVSGSTCSPYGRLCTTTRQTAFEVPAALRRMAALDVQVTVRGYGTHSPPGSPEHRADVVFWCHKYRKARVAATAGTADQLACQSNWWSGKWGTGQRRFRTPSWLRNHMRGGAASGRSTTAKPSFREGAGGDSSGSGAMSEAYAAHRSGQDAIEPLLVLLLALAYVALQRSLCLARDGRRSPGWGRVSAAGFKEPLRVGGGGGAGQGAGARGQEASAVQQGAGEVRSSRARRTSKSAVQAVRQASPVVEAAALNFVFLITPVSFVLLARGASPADLLLPTSPASLASLLLPASMETLLPSSAVALLAQVFAALALWPACVAAHERAECSLDAHVHLAPQLSFHAVSVWRSAFLLSWTMPALSRLIGRALAVPLTALLECVATRGDVRSAASFGVFVALPACLLGQLYAGTPLVFAISAAAPSLKRGVIFGWSDVATHAAVAGAALSVILTLCPL